MDTDLLDHWTIEWRLEPKLLWIDRPLLCADSKEVLQNNGTILCDDYNLHYAPGVTKAVDEFVSNNGFKFNLVLNRFAKIEKN